MYTRVNAEEAKTATKDTKARKPMMMERIAKRVTIGLVGYDKGEPIAWVSIACATPFRHLKGPEAKDGEKVWSLTCMYIVRKRRGEGIGYQLIDAAVKYARKRKADIVEAYAVAHDRRATATWPSRRTRRPASRKKVEKLGTRRTVMRLTPDLLAPALTLPARAGAKG